MKELAAPAQVAMEGVDPAVRNVTMLLLGFDKGGGEQMPVAG